MDLSGGKREPRWKLKLREVILDYLGSPDVLSAEEEVEKWQHERT